MKNFPYIHSLSTVGLIHHYNNDYLFNRVRTDFTGDSGTGKSMIADLLQLVFVGSSEFEAATESMDEKRKPKGMVLNDKKRGLSGKGYAFLNIVVDDQQYLIIGMYLENSTNYAKPFIVHKGYDLESPEFLNTPLLHASFLVEQNILPIEDLKEHLKKKELNCESMQLSSYHKFLFNQELLPFDLADNPDKLKTYALIIRSFSRGKGFKFDTKHLQDFLFGTDKEKEILSSYHQQIENIQSSHQDSLNYQKQIAELKKKKTALQELIVLEKKQIDSRNSYLNGEYSFLRNSLNDKKNQLNDVTPKLSQTVLETVLLEELDNAEQIVQSKELVDNIRAFKDSKASEPKLIEDEKRTQKQYLAKNALQEKIEQLENLLPQFDNSLNKLKEYYNLQLKNKGERSKLKSFIDELLEKGIFDEFDQSEWKKDYEKTLASHNKRIQELETEIKTNEALLNFSNVDDKKSIAFWAINRKKGFSPIEESVLIKFKELIVSNPKNIETKYLPNPEELFENIKQDYTDDNGFWLNLNGVHGYVPLVEQQFLESENPAVKKKYFSEKYDVAEKALVKAKKSRETSEQFYDSLNSISGLQENCKIYARKLEIEGFNTIDILSINQEAFDDLLIQYSRKEVVFKECQNAKTDWGKTNDELKQFQGLAKKYSKITDLDNHLEKVKNKLKSLEGKSDNLVRKKDCIRYFLYAENSLAEIESQLKQQITESSLASVLGEVKKQETELKTNRKELKIGLRTTKNELNTLKLEFKDNNMKIPNEIDNSRLKKDDIEELKTNFEKAKNNYEIAIQSLVKNFLSHDSYKYENEDDWRKLARGLLPEVFKSNEITEEQFGSEIDERLESIIEKNTVIGDRKVQLLLEVFSKVESTFSTFSTEIDRLRSFFNSNDKRITGGHKVVVKLDPSTDYPINWITEFKKQMRQESTNRTGGLFQIVDESIDFKEIIQQSFKQCRGKKSDPKIEDLLNPKKYFELSFSLQKDNIKNSGSTGQVYSAIALLCIARIALIEQGDGNKMRKGVRFMPVDEAEGLGSNYEMLSNIARSEDYQIVSMSINPVGEFDEGSHYIYMLNEPEDEEVSINGVPFAQFTEEGVAENIHEYIVECYDG